MATAAYATTIKIGGTPTTMTAEATSEVTTDTVFQITATTKRIVDPATAVTVYVDAVAQTSTNYTFDYLSGTVTFLSAIAGAGVVTITGKYIPTLSIAGAKEFSLDEKNTIQDATPFATGDAYKRKMSTTQDASGSLTDLSPLVTDYDAGAGTTTLRAAFTGAVPVLLEIRPGATGQYWRGWVLLENAGQKGSADGLLEGSVSFQNAPVAGTGRSESAGFGWVT